jgi:hypothetical protein
VSDVLLSEQKGFLHVCVAIAGAGALLAFALWLRALFPGPFPAFLEPAALALCLLGAVAWLLVMLLLTERTRASPASTRGSDRRQLTSVIRFCPGALKIAALVGIALASLQMLPLGEVSAGPGETVAVWQLRGFLAGAMFFLSASLPVIASAAWMEGGYGG